MAEQTTGNIIRTKRKEQGLTQAALAQLIGVSDKAVSRWERNQGLPDVSLLAPLADALGISVDELLLKSEIVEKVAVDTTPEAEEASDDSLQKPRSHTKLWGIVFLAVFCVVGIGWMLIQSKQERSPAAELATQKSGSDSAVVEEEKVDPEQVAWEDKTIRAQLKWRDEKDKNADPQLQWDLEVGGLGAFRAEVAIFEACKQYDFEPDLVSGVQQIVADETGTRLDIKIAGRYKDGRAAVVHALAEPDMSGNVTRARLVKLEIN